jgi:surfeit locus 1 family protein
MPIKIKNWKLAILAVVFICLFTSLGCWQLSRADQKKLLLKSFDDRTTHVPYGASDLKQPGDWRFFRVNLAGTFDNQHTVLLDNKISHSRLGYEIYTPFKANGLSTPLLVDRGFVPMGTTRNALPTIREMTGTVTITGMLNRSPTYVAFGQINESPQISWPLRIEYVNLSELAKLVGYPFFPYILSLSPTDPSAYAIEWQIVTMGPERHMGYAVQWFALALTLLILFVVLNFKRSP